MLEGRAFVIAYSDTTGKSTVYELADDGALDQRFTVPGDFVKWQRVR